MANEKVSATVDMLQPLLGMDGQPLCDPKLGEDGKPVLNEQGAPIMEPVPLRKFLWLALQAVGKLECDRGLPNDIKFEAYGIGCKLFRGDTAEFTPQELVLLEDRVAKAFPAEVAGAVRVVLNPAQAVKE